MAISHKTNRLKLVGTPAVEQLQNGRYQLTVNCTTMNSREDWYSSNKARIFPDFGSLESAEMSIDGLAPRTGEAYTDMRLVSVRSSTQQDKYIVTLVYQTLGDSFVQVKDDTISYEENGLRRVTRQSIAKAGTDFQKTVGTTSITSQIDNETEVTCFLANYEIDDTDSYREVTEVYLQSGILSSSISNRNGGTGTGHLRIEVVEAFNETPTSSIPGAVTIDSQASNVNGIPTRRFTFAKGEGKISSSSRPSTGSLSGTKEVTVVSYGTPVQPDGTLISESESEENGYVRYVRTTLQPAGGITGVKYTYQDVVEVDVPGEVTCTTQASSGPSTSESSVSGTVAIVQVEPRKTKKVTATVTVEVTSSTPTDFDVAYDMSDISCSVTTTRETFQYAPGQTVIAADFGTGENRKEFKEFSQSYALSANTQTYPGCFIAGASSATGTINYDSGGKYEFKGFVITDEATGQGYNDYGLVMATSQSTTSCEAFGSSSKAGYKESGIIKRRSRPILTDAAGIKYFEVITWTV